MLDPVAHSRGSAGIDVAASQGDDASDAAHEPDYRRRQSNDSASARVYKGQMEERLAGRSTAATSRDVRFAQLVSPWIPEMYRLAAAICGISDADDVTQDALVDAWRGFDRLREETSIRPWLHAIVANRARKDLRFRRFRPRTVEMVPEKLSAAERDPSLSVAERDRLDRAFRRLSADQRVCVALHHSIGASVPEIAVALGIPEGTVKSRINAAVVRLRTALKEEDG
jgi:RNA polymerase sigma-70 factor (ECF subfamily)